MNQASSNSGVVHVVGSGLAGSEAAYYLARHGARVVIHEMRPSQMTEAHKTGDCAELVCSNSLKSKDPVSAPGMLKAEMNRIGSLILDSAAVAEVPGGQALAVDRDIFSAKVTEALRKHPNVSFESGEVTDPSAAPFKDGITLLATGPLTSAKLSAWISNAIEGVAGARDTGGSPSSDLYFYDAIAPIIDASTIDMDRCFLANRYGKGDEEAYLNCPMTREEYEAFIDALTAAEKVVPKSFEKEKFFAGCQPIEAIAATGRDSLRYGPMKPVGLDDPKTGRWAHAIVQLRPENKARTAYNMVGFQTKLKYGEQSRVFRMIPALHKAEFLRLGSIHRNTYVNGPRVLRPDLSLKGHPRVYLAGQITGVEGYLESAACGLMAAIFIRQRLEGKAHEAPPANTALGALLRYVTGSDPKHYQPANMHFGLFDPHLFEGVSGLKRDGSRELMVRQALDNFGEWWSHANA